MIKEVSLYHQMNGGIHMNQLVTGYQANNSPARKSIAT